MSGQIWNIACELTEGNQIKGGLTPEAYGFPNGLSTEEYVKLLCQKFKKKKF